MLGLVAGSCGDDADDAGPVASSAPRPTATSSPTAPSAGAEATSAPTTAPPDTTALDVTSVEGVRVALTPIAELDEPVAMGLRPGDDGLYIAERAGRLRVVRDGALVDDVVLDISDLTRAGGERGFLGFAYSPAGDRLYVDYTDTEGDSHVDELVVSADRTVDADSRRQLLFQEQPYPNHNGGQLVFGPDGYLYIGFGDGGSGNDPERRARDLGTWLGKILRIDPTPTGDAPYTVPPDNPFVGRVDARPEIWSYGLRNPWRFTFDAATGDLWIGDVGQGALEEISRSLAADGAGRATDYGWSAYEGTRPLHGEQVAPGQVPPIYEYPHGELGCSVTGGFVYRGASIPELAGAYVFADYCAGGVRSFAVAGGVASVEQEINAELGSIASFGEGPDRELYALSLEGTVARLDRLDA